MKKQLLFTCLKILPLFLMSSFLFLSSCSDDSDDEIMTTVNGKIIIPEAAEGKTWYVILDDDIDGNNGNILQCSGSCDMSENIAYTIKNVPIGTYYLYAVVFVASDGLHGPQPGDYIGFYDGTFPDNIPDAPNAIIQNGINTFDVHLTTFLGEITSGTWEATAEFGGFDFVVNSESELITEIKYIFSDWSIGTTTLSGSVIVSSNPGLDISDRHFQTTYNFFGDPDDHLTIEGTFNAKGNKASGTWSAEYNGVTDSGVWQAVPKLN